MTEIILVIAVIVAFFGGWIFILHKQEQKKEKKALEVLKSIFCGAKRITPIVGMPAIQVRKSGSASIFGRFFLIAGDFEGEGACKEEDRVYFAWEMKDGLIATSYIPLSKVRLEPADKSPIVTFYYNAKDFDPEEKNLQAIIDQTVEYVVFKGYRSSLPVEVSPF